jgi:hypothetical protein
MVHAPSGHAIAKRGYVLLDANVVVAYARQDTPPPTWQVWHARTSFFIRQALIGTLVLALGAVGVGYLLSHATTVFVLGTYGSTDGGQLDAGPFMAWRTADFVVLALLGAVGAYTLIRRAAEAPGARDQVLVLMPDGVVFGTGASPRAVAFASLRTVSSARYRGIVTLTFNFINGGKTRMTLDGRFGKPNLIAQSVIAAYRKVPA